MVVNSLILLQKVVKTNNIKIITKSSKKYISKNHIMFVETMNGDMVSESR